jgi:endonuclease/exonuclease/phosphatase (EEP) superfamily protein YafD
MNPSTTERVQNYFRKSIRQLVWALLVFSLLGYLGTVHRLFELFCHFRLQYLWCAILGGVALLAFRDFRTSLVALTSLSINAFEVLPWYFGKPPAPAAGDPALKVLLANVYTDNRESAALLALIARENPDVVVLVEINDRWVRDLLPLAKTHPHFETVPRDDNFGIGIWSRLPAQFDENDTDGSPRRVAPLPLFSRSEDDVPSLKATFSVGLKQITLLATHPVPPVRGEMFEWRNRQLAQIASWVRSVRGPCIVVGDLNMSLWSPYHARLLRDSGLKNARQGFGVLPSWPTMIPFMEIPLDHCLISPGIGVRAIHTGPKIGSDHLPLIVELAL